MDDLIKEMQRISEAFKAHNQELELDIQKVINTLRGIDKLTREEIEALDKVMHDPSILAWKRQPDLPEPEVIFQLDEKERGLQFLRELIRQTPSGETWGVPSTGQRYRIDHSTKTFTLFRDTDRDEHNWHGKNKVLLAILGWKMVDGRDKTYVFKAEKDGWTISLVSFLVDNQENSKTPGQNFPPGSRGSECLAVFARKGVTMRLGPKVGAHMARTIALISGISEPEQGDTYGPGKTAASSSFLLDESSRAE